MVILPLSFCSVLYMHKTSIHLKLMAVTFYCKGSLQTKLRLLDSMWWFLISYMGILMYLMILRSPFKFWLKAHGTDKGYKDAKSVIADLKSKGIAAVGAAGFCWGAKVVVELAKTGEIQAAVLCHPSFVTVDDIKEVKSPISILGAEVDKSSPPELVKQFEEILSGKTERGLHSRNKKAMELIAKGWNALNEVDRVIDCTDLNDHRLYPYFRVDSFVKIFPGVAHGWTVRYSVDDAGAVKKAEEAHEDMLVWFTKHIK